MKENRMRRAMGLALAGLLAGCSSGPSEDDVRSAIQTEVDRSNEQIVAMAGRQMAARVGSYELQDLELIGCEPSGESFTCDIVVSISSPIIPIRNQASTVRLRESDRGWVLMGGISNLGMGAMQ